MTVVLIFLAVVLSTSIWWLSHQRLGAKPWLESGLKNLDHGSHKVSLPKAKIGLLVVLAVVGMLFTLLFSSHFMRQEIEDWRSMPLPNMLWVNGILLLAASLYLQSALVVARRQATRVKILGRGTSMPVSIENNGKHDNSVKSMLINACILTVAFLIGQSITWYELNGNGIFLSGNPSSSFFYVLTGLHGLHIIGGLVALFHTTALAGSDTQLHKIVNKIDLCALYWHFLFFIWCAMIFVMLGWTYDPLIELCKRVIS
jgi:cytochrome c oxidase subunit 3|tara:strand:- start:1102 stop:1875 length:774 start_codon:yes stop_codon:yes gene_type:complete